MSKSIKQEDCVRILRDDYNLELLSNYKNAKEYLIVKCLECGNVFERNWSNITNKTHPQGCSNCKGIKNDTLKINKMNKEIDVVCSKNNFQRLSDCGTSKLDIVWFKCKICNNEFDKSYLNLTNSPECPICGKSAPVTKYKIIRFISENCGYIEYLDNYINEEDTIIIKYKCSKCNKISLQPWASFSKPKRNEFCTLCAKEKSDRNKSLSYEYVKNMIYEKTNGNIEMIQTHYINSNSPIECMCNVCKNPIHIRYADVVDGCYKRGCRGCWISYNRGENHYSWNSTLDPNYRKFRRLYTTSEGMSQSKWRKIIFERDNYTCQICGNRNHKNKGRTIKLNAHHLYPWSSFPEKRFDLMNGITLCEDCHSQKSKGGFHRIYGTRSATYEDFVDFYKEKTGKEFLYDHNSSTKCNRR